MSQTNRYHIGTSGWHYGHWKKVFYPKEISDSDFLSFYADHFDTVEINNSFYQLPETGTFEEWRKTTGSDFIYAVKASRYITHMKKLKDPEQSISNFFTAAKHLKGKLGPVLFQLPPRWHRNTERLDSFLGSLPGKHRYAFEFRDSSWMNEETYSVLSNHNAAFCIYDMHGEVSPEIVTADFVYIRLHGPQKEAYEGHYTRHQLNSWAQKLRDWLKEDKDIFCYFNNDQQGFAVDNAQTLLQIMSG